MKFKKFNWNNFAEEDYNKYLEKCVAKIFDSHDYLGAVRIGDICIELLDSDWFGEDGEYDELEKILVYNFYVAHEDTGYGYKNDTLPYDYAGEGVMDVPYGMSYDEFKNKAEEMFKEFIIENDEANDYSLVKHAKKKLEIW